MDQERRGLVTTYDLLHEAIKETYDSLLTSLDTRYAGTDRQLRAQLNSLGTMLPTVQMHLIMCTTFSSTANKFEFLTMAHHLIDRLTALAHLTYPLRPGHTSDLATDYKVRFVECLEPVLSSLGVAGPPEAAANTANGHGGHRGGGEGGEQAGLANGGVASSGRAASKSLPTTPKHRSAARVEFQTDFPEHCQMFDGHMKVLNKRFGGIKGAVSDLHRDVTTRRCLTSYDRVEDIVRECVTIKTDLDRADDMMDEHKMEFEKRWQQEQLRIKTEQAMFNEQVSTVHILYLDCSVENMRCECFRAAINCFRWKCCAEFGVRSWDISPDIYFVSKVVRNGEYKVDRRQILWRVRLCARVISTR